MGFFFFFFFFLDVAILSNARAFLLKIDRQLEDQKDDIFLVTRIALKVFFILHKGLYINPLKALTKCLVFITSEAPTGSKKALFFNCENEVC